jgi:hypothetical protein
MRLHEHSVCKRDYAGMEVVDAKWRLLLTAYASRIGGGLWMIPKASNF